MSHHCHHHHTYLAYRIAHNNAQRIPPDSWFWHVFDVLFIWPLKIGAAVFLAAMAFFVIDFAFWLVTTRL